MDLRLVALFFLLLPNAEAADFSVAAEGAAAMAPDTRLDPMRAQRGYVGATVCGECHEKELALWRGSHHDLAMTRATAATVLGDFDDAEINLGCESCHGPGVRHVEWARAVETGQTPAATDASSRGLLVDLKDRDGGVWRVDQDTGKPERSVPRAPQGGPHVQTEICAPCHARRGRLSDEVVPGAPLHQGFRLALLEPALYFADGQIDDEVFVHGSFIQSRMYHQGVVGGDCHEPHSLSLLAEGNAVCARCHVAARYDTPEHHHHQPESSGAACVDCHMPQRFYMVVDERADHSLRVPRPDLSVKIGTPNACNGCQLRVPAHWSGCADGHQRRLIRAR